jgi:HD-GYP domain-containing protein (c-di-GMP phosphodiesterase class II)
MRELEEGKGIQFDPDIVDAFLRAYQEGASLPIPTPQLQPLRLPMRVMEARRA